MTAEEFITWLKGYLEGLQSNREEIKVIGERLAFLTCNTDLDALKQKMRIHAEIPQWCPPYPLKKYHL
jgi:hypothetical protein